MFQIKARAIPFWMLWVEMVKTHAWQKNKMSNTMYKFHTNA